MEEDCHQGVLLSQVPQVCNPLVFDDCAFLRFTLLVRGERLIKELE
jgi:hypothetical protein